MSSRLIIPDSKEIGSASALRELLDFLDGAIEENLIEQYWRSDDEQIGGNTPETVREIVSSGTWPDHIDWYFLWKETGNRYHLSVETYHGAGGSWERLDGTAH